MTRDAYSRLVRAWLTTAVADGLFSSGLAALAYGSTVTRLWQSVASALLGPPAMEGGTRTVLIGVIMHVGVALAWSVVFFAAYEMSKGIRAFVASPFGVLKTASIYGPVIWMVMSFVVIQSLTHRPPTITYRWWVQFFGHIPFVAVPIVASIARRAPAATAVGAQFASSG